MDIKVTFDATPAFIAAFGGLIAALTPQQLDSKGAVNGTGKKEKGVKEPVPTGELIEVKTGNGESGLMVTGNIDDEQIEKKPEPQPDTKTKITLEQVRQAVQAKAADGKQAGIKETLKSFGCAKVTEVATEQYGAFLEKINAL